jgi:hypothetical protein
LPRGAHRIIEYAEQNSTIGENLTVTPHRPHRVISYNNPASGDGSDLTNEKRGGSE